MKMNELFEFLLDEEILKTKLREVWIKIYDPNYVDEKIIGGLLKTADDVEDLLGFLYQKARNALNEKEKEDKEKKEDEVEERR